MGPVYIAYACTEKSGVGTTCTTHSYAYNNIDL